MNRFNQNTKSTRLWGCPKEFFELFGKGCMLFTLIPQYISVNSPLPSLVVQHRITVFPEQGEDDSLEAIGENRGLETMEHETSDPIGSNDLANNCRVG